jgi:hypothetical protein
MASPVGTSFLDHFAALRDPRQGWKVVFPLSDDEAPRLEAPAEIDITTVILARKQPVGLGPATCVASEPETWTAFAILSGISSEALAGEQILIHWEFPRLCRGGSRSLTFPGVCPGFPTEDTLMRAPPKQTPGRKVALVPPGVTARGWRVSG